MTGKLDESQGQRVSEAARAATATYTAGREDCPAQAPQFVIEATSHFDDMARSFSEMTRLKLRVENRRPPGLSEHNQVRVVELLTSDYMVMAWIEYSCGRAASHRIRWMVEGTPAFAPYPLDPDFWQTLGTLVGASVRRFA
jgi:hypothetical protein